MLRFFKNTTILLLIICFTSFLLTIYKQREVNACINADEAAFGYSAYSILKTGKDEYGTKLPIRFKSFGDNKLPLYSYLSVPFVATFGLNDLGTKGLNLLISFLLPLSVYFLAMELLGKKSYGLVAAALTALSLSTHITVRQAHESVLSLLLSISMFIFYLRAAKSNSIRDKILFLLSTALSLLSYQPARLLVLLLGTVHLVRHFMLPKVDRKKSVVLGGLFIAVVSLFLVTDVIYNPSRVTNLFFTNSPGFSLRINELRGEGGNRIIYNKLTLGAQELAYQNLAYFSPQFLLSRGDENYRFGYPGMSLITLLEYFFLFVGLYYLFKNKAKSRFILLAMLVVAPLSGSLSWAGISLTRVLFLFTTIFIITGYGAVELINEIPKKLKLTMIGLLIFIQLIGLLISWDFYLNHYTKRAIVNRSQECGYKELTDFIKMNYGSYKKFYITKQHGQPYIHLLYNLKYPPAKYQSQAHLSAPDQYGFGQVERFDKFVFSLPNELTQKNVVYIGYPEEIKSRPGFNSETDTAKLKTIKVGTEDIFSILER